MRNQGLKLSIFAIMVLMAFCTLARAAGSDEPLKPIRQAKLRYALRKATFDGSSGDIAWHEEVVCSGTAEVGVFDLRQNPDGRFTVSRQLCAAKVAGQDVTLVLASIIAFSREVPFPEDGEVDLKSFTGLLWVEPQGQSAPIQDIVNQVTWTKDLNQRTSGLVLNPSVKFNCSEAGSGLREPSQTPSALKSQSHLIQKSRFEVNNSICKPDLTEYFVAFIQFED